MRRSSPLPTPGTAPSLAGVLVFVEVAFEPLLRGVLVVLGDDLVAPAREQRAEESPGVVRAVEQDVLGQRHEGQALGFRSADQPVCHRLRVEGEQPLRVLEILGSDVA